MEKLNFPEQIYVGIEYLDKKPFFVTDSDYEGLSLQNDVREIAIYYLVRVAKIVNKSVVV